MTINTTKLYLDTLDKRIEFDKLKLFKQFLDYLPNDISREELIKENKLLRQSDFINLIDKYYDNTL